jgi:hypothetical protein
MLTDMSLIECPECTGKVSDKASACTHCGCPASFYDESEYGKEESNEEGSNEEGHDREGYDKEGYDKEGYE